MKISLAWLNTYLDRPADADEVEALLTDLGFPIEQREQLEGDDEMLDAEVTSNRGDCLSHVGLAREIAAASGRSLRLPECDAPEHAAPGAEELTGVAIQAPDLCPLYTARVIRGVRVGPSPAWLVRCLEAIGLRSVNNVVDVTNFVMMEFGQPLHAFDMAKLDQGRIVVRRAAEGEAITAIDGTRHTLGTDMLVIADASRPVAVAGIMGGLDTEVGPDTADVLLESAVFDPLNVRTTSRALKLSSDSNYRFERGVDPLGAETASRRAARLIVELTGGTLAPGLARAGDHPPEPRTIAMRPQRCRDLLGIDLPEQRMVEILDRLGLAPQPDDTAIRCTVPSHRLDLAREADLVEEVARVHGLGHVPVHERIHIVARAVQPEVAARQHLARVLIAHGYHETVTFSFLSPAKAEAFLPDGAEPLRVDDDRRKAEPMLRPSVVPSLLDCRKANQDVGNHGVQLFETASVWHRSDGRIVEGRRLALLRDTGDDASAAARAQRRVIEALADELQGTRAVEVRPDQRPGMTAFAQVRIQERAVGWVGVPDAKLLDLFALQAGVVLAELDLPGLLTDYPPQRRLGALPRFPAIERDLSVVVPEPTPWEHVAAAVQEADPALLEEVRFLTVFRGKQVGAGQKSVSFRMLFRDPGQTLRHEQVDPQVQAVVAALKQRLGAELRG